MAILLNNVATTDQTSDNEISTPNAVGLSILIANAAVIANFKQVPREGAGNSNEMPWGPDLLLAPQTAQYRNVSGFRCRSAISGVPARVVAVLSEKSDPQALGATPYTAVLAASGGVTPGANSVEVDHNGAVIGTEPKLDFEDAIGFGWTIADDPANSRVKITPPQPAVAVLLDFTVAVPQSNIDTLVILGGNIPQTFNHLELLIGVESATAALVDTVRAQINGIGSASYNFIGSRENNGTLTPISNYGDTAWSMGVCPGNTLSNWSADLQAWFSRYTSTRLKSFRGQGGFAANGPPSGFADVVTGTETAFATPIIRINLFMLSGANFAVGSRVILRGHL
jgi:hypothetical protein